MDTSNILVVIPARAGSKGVPGKNVKLLGGKPLIQYTIDVARKLVPDNQIIISTDSIEIKNIVEELGLEVPFLRPVELATDTAGTNEVLIHALEFYENKKASPDKIVLLQPTSPFRKVEHIRDALKIFENTIDMVVSVKETSVNPYYILHEENKEGYLVKSKKGNFKRRQDCPKVWELNGAIYIINYWSLKTTPMANFKKVRKYEMNEFSSIDIDTSLDWILAETLILNQNQ